VSSPPALRSALAYAAKGWPVLPLHSPIGSSPIGPGCSCGQASCGGKHPRSRHGFHDATIDPQVIKAWWARWPDAGVGIRTGSASGLVVIDVDPAHGGQASFNALLQDHGGLRQVPLRVRTGGDGWHLYFAHPGGSLPNDAGRRLGPGLDVRGDGGYVVAPPSIHQSTKPYRWVGGHLPLTSSTNSTSSGPGLLFWTSHTGARFSAITTPVKLQGIDTDASPLLSTTQVAHHLGITESAVRALIRDGRLPAYRSSQRWNIWQSDLEAFNLDLPPNSRAGCPNAASVQADARVLGLIAERPGITVVDLTEITGEYRRTVLGRLQRLDRRGLITRRSEQSRAPHRCRLTDAGWQHYRTQLA